MPIFSRLFRPLAGLALLLCAAVLAPGALAADDFEDPGFRIRQLDKKFRADLAGDSQLKRCQDEALKDYLSGHLGEFLSIHNLITDMAFKLTSERLSDMPEDRQEKLKAEFAKFIVSDNFAALKLACSAKKLQILGRDVDFTVSRVETSLQPKGRKPVRVNFLLLRGWDKWLVANVGAGQTSLSDKYRELLGPAIATGGYEGLLNRLINLNM